MKVSDWVEKHPKSAKRVLDHWYKHERPKAMQARFDDLKPDFEHCGWTAHPDTLSFSKGNAGWNVNIEFNWVGWWRQKHAKSVEQEGPKLPKRPDILICR